MAADTEKEVQAVLYQELMLALRDRAGAGTFEAVCNGDATSLESFKSPTMKLFNGQLVVIVRSGRQPGTLTLKITDTQLSMTETIDIQVN